MFLAATLVATGLLSLVHIYVGRLRFLDNSPGIWKSAAGGVGIAYTFLVLLPKISKAQSVLERTTESGLYGFLVHHSYLVALIGLVIYYGMDSAVERILVQTDKRAGRPLVRAFVYAHASVLSGYYFLVSYLMSEIREAGNLRYTALGVFELAMLLHYLTIDHGLRNKYGALYDFRLRWTFVVATLGGWATAAITELPYASVALLNCLFAGALIVFTLKEKVPGSDYVRFRPFLAGVVGYALMLLAIEVLGNASQ